MREEWDAIVVGSGHTGILVAETLCAKGWSCLVLEAGPVPDAPLPRTFREFEATTRPLLEIDDDSWRFRSSRPFDWVRVRAAGGRSLVWGGWCIAPDQSCFTEAREQGVQWPIRFAELAPFVDRAGRFMRVRASRLHPRMTSLGKTLGIDLLPKHGSTAVGGQRPMTSLDRIRKAQLRGHSVVLRVVRDEKQRAAGVEVAGARPGETHVLRARVVVLAASPIETARILHATDPTRIGAADGPLGRGLVDHMAATLWVINEERPPVAGLSGAHDRAAWALRRSRSSHGGHVLEVFGPIAVSMLSEPLLSALGLDRQAAASLSYFMIYTAAAAMPTPRRRVSFDGGERDALDRPVPVLRLAWSARDRDMARRLDFEARQVAEALAGRSGRIIRQRDPLDPGGIGHETGTCRMGATDDSVTDPAGAVRGIPRLFVADASILPGLFNRHPTWTLLAMALRIAHGIAEQGRRLEL